MAKSPAEEILRDPFRNKGTAFTKEERKALGLDGLLPYHIATLQDQVKRRYEAFSQLQSDTGRYLFLSSLQNRNETLFYKLVSEHLGEMLPYIYTPKVGEVSQKYSYLYTDPRGLFLSYPMQDQIEEMVQNFSQDDVEVMVVTDGERILGLGDLGVGGMAIPIGKLALYTLFGGIHPAKAVPIVFDVGTNNEELLNDPLYIGWRHPRISGKEYDDFIDRCIKALHKRYPKALLQWEDFGRDHARPLLERYRHTLCSFNDDIQGTAAAALAGVLAAVRLKGSVLSDQTIVIFGAGSAGIGIAHYFAGEMKSKENIYIIDKEGLVHEGLQEIPSHQRPFARPIAEVKKFKNPNFISLEEVISVTKATVLIGVSAQKGAFTQAAISKMGSRPIIFPLSNPHSKCEADPADLAKWTKGEAIIATGSRFDGFAQCNNVYIFPGVGLGVIASKAKEVTDTMFYKAAEVLSRFYEKPPHLFPSYQQLPHISREIALGVMEVAKAEGVAQSADPKQLDAVLWTPKYE